MKTFNEFLAEHRYKGRKKPGVKLADTLPYQNKKEHQAFHSAKAKAMDVAWKEHVKSWDPRTHPETELTKRIDKAYTSISPKRRGTTKNIKVTKLRATQPGIEKDFIDKTKRKDPPEAYEVGGKFFVHDGHHRIIRDMKRGKKRIKLYFRSLDHK